MNSIPCRLTSLLALGGALAGALPVSAQTWTWTENSVIAPSATRYDLAVSGSTVYVAYENSGTIYVTSRTGSGNWSSPTTIGAGSAPSITVSGATVNLAFVNSSTVQVATYSGSWSAASSLGNINGTTRVMLRTDGAGTMYLLSEGSGTSGRGSLDLATNTGSGWGSFTNLAYGWYDSGSGLYYHQGILATGAGTGYRLGLEVDNWGGQASWSSKALTTSGFSSDSSMGYGWNSSGLLGNSALALGTGGNAIFGHVVSGTGYIDLYNGTTWAGAASLGSATYVSVGYFEETPFAIYASGGQLYQTVGGAPSAVAVGETSLSGSSPLLFTWGDQNAMMLYLDGSNQLVLASAVPEPAAYAACAGLLALAAVAWRRRRLNGLPPLR